MKTTLTAFAFAMATLAGTAHAQITEGVLSFALPEHSGRLTLKQGDFKIAQLSAKPEGREFGIRAKDGDLHLLGFLFLVPENPHLTAETCREETLKNEGAATLAATRERATMKSASGAEIATALMIPVGGKFSTLRAFVASGDLCGDLSFSYALPVATQKIPMDRMTAILQTVTFDPQARPTFREAFAYATVDYDQQQMKAAAYAYRAALKMVDTSDDPQKWRRVTTDQLSMALGISGDLKGSRAVNEEAIAKDPAYPLYYYNLACADAEAGDAAAARTHLQQAYDRRANTLAGERFPDPSADDSFLKLKSDKKFWEFVQTISPKAKS